jgi:hypothetical protein
MWLFMSRFSCWVWEWEFGWERGGFAWFKGCLVFFGVYGYI